MAARTSRARTWHLVCGSQVELRALNENWNWARIILSVAYEMRVWGSFSCCSDLHNPFLRNRILFIEHVSCLRLIYGFFLATQSTSTSSGGKWCTTDVQCADNIQCQTCLDLCLNFCAINSICKALYDVPTCKCRPGYKGSGYKWVYTNTDHTVILYQG